jgi:RNA polymerase sigma-70 factor (ECF subfamily)
MNPSTLASTGRLLRPVVPTADAAASSAEIQAEVLHLFDACAPGLRRYVRSCGLLPEAADDVVQEAFLALFHHLRRGGGTSNLKGWLVVVSCRLALKHRARIARRRQIEMVLDAPLAAAADPAMDVESAIVRRQGRQRIQAVLRALPERERQCLAMRAEGVTYRSIASTLGISLGAVAKAVSRAAVRLTAAVKE